MEFRYRAVDGDRPPPATDTAPSQSLNCSFFSARLNPGCDIGQGQDHVLEAAQREIEKEQIRQEIIAAETARRRELIAEVVQEMAIERAMVIRRVAETRAMSLEQKLTMWINQKNLANLNQMNNSLFRHKCTYGGNPMMHSGPYSLATSPMMQPPRLQQLPEATGAKATPMMQLPRLQQFPEATGAKEATPALESNKEKLIVLDRPDPIGAKRKAEDTQTGLETANDKADGVGLPEKEPYKRLRLHSKARAKEMKRAQAAAMRNTTVETEETDSSKLPCSGLLESGKQVETEESKTKSRFKFWCDVCRVGAVSETVMRSHELGKKHKAAIEKHSKLPETAASTSIVTPLASVAVPQSDAVAVPADAEGQKVDEMVRKKTEGEKKKTVIIRCETCNILTYSEQVMETHKLGKKHKALLKKQYSEQVMETHRLEKKHSNKPLAVLDNNVIRSPARSLNADPGEKGSIDHTKGKVHCLD